MKINVTDAELNAFRKQYDNDFVPRMKGMGAKPFSFLKYVATEINLKKIEEAKPLISDAIQYEELSYVFDDLNMVKNPKAFQHVLSSPKHQLWLNKRTGVNYLIVFEVGTFKIVK